MKEDERQTRSYLMRLFERHGFNPRSDLGQNFLIDLNIIEYVVEQGHIKPTDIVLEVGTGTGGMTTFMAQKARHVISVEYDRNMHTLASEATQKYDNITLLNCDALKNKNRLNPVVLEEIDQQLKANPGSHLKLVANLPYNVATPIISNLVASDLPWNRMVVTIQYELGLKMSCKPATSNYGALSVWLQSQCFVKLLKKVGPTVFWPRPKVDSAIVQLTPNPPLKQKIEDRVFFQDFLRRVFQHRRKLMRSTLVGMYSKQLSKAEVDALLEAHGYEREKTRAEELTVPEMIELANAFQEQITRNANI
ncbi:16S rRNA (adenine(1518)-N(6)/adenine(1519)-N(6))-dimethyltransferase RsmA [Gimesia chilikensis]|jgi:16S rRNA (adenine1518-N6/adenine1519-N6)-dimethyltransferase|uniref:16S rRNA (adenine(1518)-N(6)/adenine(1519)-N(6))- dimethyltransferase RsmA n=1 Tax=Gimesia chilikensis TaxID=2605989 RepID=UPI000C577BD6|nr:16S rRNA (adenine(1518)-N(6)/adenine(1519)-N(6))-dimethyltransferase RsmA [Gimesia chilikensis]MBN71496.1 ribosomal RNA small subunit methyltransferase A [Gimesia sp.]QDT88200.1 Ribosomal RNA adenine dimethylase [Gimesia chilikensis]